MPELPEVETTKKSLEPLLNQNVQAVRLYQPKLRWQIPADITSLVGYRLASVERRAKYLILNFELASVPRTEQTEQVGGSCKNQKSLIIHLGMSGSLQQYAIDTEKRKHDHLILDFVDIHGRLTQLHYHDPRKFGAVLWADVADETGKTYRQRLLNHLGVEPLDTAFYANYLYRYIHRLDEQGNKISKQAKPISRAIKSVIMEQKVVVGVGNIYATESLFLAGIHPSMPANKITLAKLNELVAHIKTVLAKAIKQGGSTLQDFSVGGGTTGYFQQTLLVYGHAKQPCPQCETTIESVKINGRASTYCPKCQFLSQ